MISSVRGEVLEVALDHVVIECAGVGYHVNATPSTLATLRHGSEARLITAMIVREDSQTLYGFGDRDTRDLFLTLLSVSGVGPRLAMATLAAVLEESWPNTARTFGPRTSTPLNVPSTYPAIISQPVRKPR